MKLLALLLLLPLCAYGQATGVASRYDNFVQTTAKNAPYGAEVPILSIPGSSVSVWADSACMTTPVKVYFDQAETTPLQQPIITDNQGKFGYWIPAGTYFNLIVNPAGTTLACMPVSIGSFTNFVAAAQVNVDSYPGADLGLKLQNAQAALNGANATLIVSTAATLSTATTLLAGNDLRINVPVAMSAAVTLAGSNQVSCSSNGMLTVTTPNPFTSTANNLDIHDCNVLGVPKATDPPYEILGTTNSSHIRIVNNYAVTIGLVSTVGGSDLLVEGNTIANPSFYGYGVLWSKMSDVRVNANSFTNVADPVEYFNGDADPNHGSTALSRAAVSGFAGHYIISNNTCLNAGACYWGSVAHDVVVTGNYASNCADVCYDYEGSIDVVVSGNHGDTANNGVGTTFFFSDHVSWIGNEFSSSTGTPLIAVHNSSLSPSFNEYQTVQGNTLNCFTVICQAVGGDAAGDVTVTSNRMTNATVNFGSYGGNTIIKRNELTFTMTSPAAFNAIETPNLLNGALLQVEDNTVTGPSQPAGSACIANYSADFNSVVTLYVSSNHCFGGFPIDLSTTNGGTNGGTGVVTILSENWWGQNNVTHTHTTGNYDNYQEVSKYTSAGGVWSQTHTPITIVGGASNQVLNLSSASTTNAAVLLSNTSTGGRSWGMLVTGSNEPATGVGDLSFTDLTNGNYALRLHALSGNAGYVEVGGGMGYTWSPGSAENSPPDTGMCRTQPGVIGIGNGPCNGASSDLSGSIASFGVIGPATAPTGSCGTAVPGAWVFSRDGHASVCIGSTWVSKI